MPEPAPCRPIAIVGPTATGKTSLAEDLAVARSGEIVTADSMQVYRGMDIGTAKIPEDARRVPHHCIDLIDPGQPYSAALFQRDARKVIDELCARDTLSIVAGGTGLYVRAALDEMSFPSGEVSSKTRLQLEEEARTGGAEALHTRLAELDPDSAALIHPNNVRRTIRALEMAEQGVSYSAQAAQFAERVPHYDALYLGLDLDRDALYERIEHRVDRMLDDGLLEEVAQLLDRGFRDALTSAQAIGYKEFVPVVEKETDVAIAASEVKKATRRYAKRQLTWFRRDTRVNWIDVGGMTPGDIAAAATALIESSERREPRR